MNPLLRSLALLVVCFAFAGCMSIQSPKKLTTAERALVTSAGFTHLTVGVEAADNQARVSADSYIDSLRRTHLFKEVGPLGQFSTPPDLVMRVDRCGHPFSCLTGPGSLVIMTLGLAPYNLGYDASIDFTLAGRTASTPLRITHSDKGDAWWGSATSLLALSPNWTLNASDLDRRAQRLALTLAMRREEILALANRQPTTVQSK